GEFDRNPWLLNVANGTLDLEKGELRERSRDDLITKIAPVSYDPSATCPRWTRFLEEISLGSGELMGLLKRLAGYALTGDTSERALFLLHGTGANGKSTFLEVLSAMMGDYAYHAPASTFMPRQGSGPQPEVVALKGARLVSCSEFPEFGHVNEALLKAITG